MGRRNGSGHGTGLKAPAAVPDSTDEGRGFGEVKVGLRCAGCGSRITKGFEFTRVQVMKDPITLDRAVLNSKTTACLRPECDYAIRCAKDATAVRRVEYLFLDDPRVAAMFQGHSAEGPGGKTPRPVPEPEEG